MSYWWFPVLCLASVTSFLELSMASEELESNATNLASENNSRGSVGSLQYSRDCKWSINRLECSLTRMKVRDIRRIDLIMTYNKKIAQFNVQMEVNNMPAINGRTVSENNVKYVCGNHNSLKICLEIEDFQIIDSTQLHYCFVVKEVGKVASRCQNIYIG